MKTANRIEVAKLASEFTIELIKLEETTLFSQTGTVKRDGTRITANEPLALFDSVYQHMLHQIGK